MDMVTLCRRNGIIRKLRACSPGRNFKLGLPCRFVFSLTSTYNSSGGPAAHVERGEGARTSRAPAGDSVPCTPVYEWISVYYHLISKSTMPFYPGCKLHFLSPVVKMQPGSDQLNHYTTA